MKTMDILHTKPIITLDLTDSTINNLEHLLPIKPKRWGRMDILSKFLIIGCAKVLEVAMSELKQEVGLLCATTYGSLSTDIEYAKTISIDVKEASPILFGYTLPNISLSEAAAFFKFKGAVYANIYDPNITEEDMLTSVIKKAAIWLNSQELTKSFIVCTINFLTKEAQDRLKINRNLNKALFTWVV